MLGLVLLQDNIYVYMHIFGARRRDIYIYVYMHLFGAQSRDVYIYVYYNYDYHCYYYCYYYYIKQIIHPQTNMNHHVWIAAHMLASKLK